MKQVLIVAAIALFSLTTVSCGSTNDKNNKPVTAQQSAQAQLQSAQINKNDFSVLPKGAEKALDVAAERAASVYGTDGKRSFGYTGTTDIEGSECYCFSVFTTKDETTYHVADLAVTADGEKVFASEAGKSEYSALSEPVKAGSWSDTKTAAFAK